MTDLSDTETATLIREDRKSVISDEEPGCFTRLCLRTAREIEDDANVFHASRVNITLGLGNDYSVEYPTAEIIPFPAGGRDHVLRSR